MLRHTAFAVVSLLACSVASAQYPITPFGTYGTPRYYPASNPTVGTYGIQSGGCVGGNCATGNCPNGRCATGNCSTGNCANGNCTNGGMVCGPNGCFPANSTSPYVPRLPQGSYPLPSSSYPSYQNYPSAYRSRSFPTMTGAPLFRTPAPFTNNWNYYTPVTGAADPYDAYSGPGVLH